MYEHVSMCMCMHLPVECQQCPEGVRSFEFDVMHGCEPFTVVSGSQIQFLYKNNHCSYPLSQFSNPCCPLEKHYPYCIMRSPSLNNLHW